MRTALILAACALALWAIAGCTSPNPGPCPPVKEYSPEFTQAFREQLKTIPEGSPVAVFVLDSVTLRGQVRACN